MVLVKRLFSAHSIAILRALQYQTGIKVGHTKPAARPYIRDGAHLINDLYHVNTLGDTIAN